MRRPKNLPEEEEESSEMEVDGEEKMEHSEESSFGDNDMADDDDEAEATTGRANNETPFLDSFYGLSSEDPRERSQAAQTMLQHCLLGPSANTKDASYAFRRILNGLCSGRAAARQGNASALASYLKLAFHLKKIESIQNEMDGEIPPTGNSLSFVREKLLAATDPSQISGKKKGSEERDYQFGRLFGILGIVRSNILVPDKRIDTSLSDTIEVASSLVSDLAELFWLKKWMREPAAHGITTLLKMFFDGKPNKECTKVLDHIISKIVIPRILKKEAMESNRGSLIDSYCAEQIGIACFIQSRSLSQTCKSLFPLNEPILSIETMPLISKALAETSVVLQPRTHFVWDTIWCYLFETEASQTKKGKATQRNLRAHAIIGEDTPVDLIDALIKEVIMKKLLGFDSEKETQTSNATHERRSLALCLLKNLCGLPFMSSVSGPTRLCLDIDSLENLLLTPVVVSRLFLDVICAGKQNKHSSHLLKPLALEVLSSLPSAVADLESHSESKQNRHLACVRALLKAEVRFDARTKTSTISDLLHLTGTVKHGTTNEVFSFWDQYLSFLESQLITKCGESFDSSSEVTGFVELLYSAAKRIIRLEAESETDTAALKEYRNSTIRRILGFFMASAFFDCSEVEKKKGGKSKAKEGNSGEQNLILDCATQLKGVTVPFVIRSTISSRFFSLVSDYVHNETHQKDKDSQGKSVEKDAKVLSFLDELCSMWNVLESSGAERFAAGTTPEEDDSSAEEVYSVLEGLQQNISDLKVILKKKPDDSLTESKKRCCTGVAVLAYTLYLHRLSCGKDDDMIDNDNPDADEEEDEEEICNALEGLKDVTDGFLGEIKDGENPLLGLTELCANILSSPVGSGDMGRGSSPKLVREGVKFAWLGGLRLSSLLATEDHTMLDNAVTGTLMEAIGASSPEVTEDDFEGEGDSDDEDSEDDNNSSEEGSTESGDENVFLRASNLLDDPDDMDIDAPTGENRDDDESDVELDNEKLQSLLEEDSDADVDSDVLEHHEGADAALAKLIKLKQESRKAGQLAKEKIEVSNQLRCTFLIELLFGRSDAWNRLFRSDVILSMLVPMLNHRKKIEKSLNKSTESRSKTGHGEKQALLDKLTSLLKLKICKMKFSSLPLESSSLDVVTMSKLVNDILNETRRSTNRDHVSCCSSCIVFILRTIQSVPNKISAASPFIGAVEEWSTKRTTRLGTSIFDDLIEHMPSLAQITLLSPLSKASADARSPFLKSEAFRLLSMLFATKPNPEVSEIEKHASESIQKNEGELLALVARSLEDEEMKKAKRVRTVLKALEKILHCMSSSSTECLSQLETLKASIDDFDSDSNPVKVACSKIAGEIEAKVAELKAIKPQKSQGVASSSGKKKKKKKKKR